MHDAVICFRPSPEAGGAVDVHRCAHVGVSYQLLLHSGGGTRLVQQGAVGMQQRMSSEASNAHLLGGGTQVVLLDLDREIATSGFVRREYQTHPLSVSKRFESSLEYRCKRDVVVGS